MKKIISLVCLLISSNLMAFYNPVFGPICGLSYRYESYSLGLQFGFQNEFYRPLKLDQFCWELGEKAGKALLSHERLSACQEAYEDGKEHGLKGQILTISMPSECSNAGYTVGLTMLSVWARKSAQNNSDDCGKAYNKGLKDAGNNYVPVHGSNNRLNHCYDTGYQDFHLL